jgi:hypothetical protein
MRAIVVAAVVLALSGAASLARGSSVADVFDVPTSAEALAGDYGDRIVDHVTDTFEASADPACRRERSIGPLSRELVRAWLTRYGQRTLDRFSTPQVEREARETMISARGAEAPATLETLARHPRVRPLTDLARGEILDTAADNILAALARHIDVAGLRLSRPVDPFAAGARELNRLREQRRATVSRATWQYRLAHRDVVELERFVSLFNVRQQAVAAAADRISAPHVSFDGIITDLEAHCIGRR